MILKQAIKLLEEQEQLHLLKYYEELKEEEQIELLKQIEEIDFSFMKQANNDLGLQKGTIAPIQVLTISEIQKEKEKFMSLGLEALIREEVGAVILAGGSGSRLGFHHAKGMYNIGITKDVYIFQRLIENLMEVVRLVMTWIPLYIMTSQNNHEEIVTFFREMDYFGYNKVFITFFVQDMVPAVDYNDKIILEEKGKILLSPNGNGGWFSSMKKCGILNEIHRKNIKWLNVFSVDNVLQKIADPCFIGAVIASGNPSGAKVIKKVSKDEKVGNICIEDGRPSIIEYYDLTVELKNQTNEYMEPLYNYGVILNYLFLIEDLDKIHNLKLPVHKVEKKINYLNEGGIQITPGDLSGYKFEILILDMIHLLEGCLPYEVNRGEEFAPIKNKTGIDSLDTARILLQENGIEV